MKTHVKKQIAGSFSEHSGSYDQYSLLQEKSAGFLLEIIRQCQNRLPLGPVLEVGCGSGLLSSILAEMFVKMDLDLLDIAPGMLLQCRKNLEQNGCQHPSINFIEMDAETISKKGHYALIVSGLTVQWFAHFKRSITRIFAALRPGGVFIFSFLEVGSFPEWHEQCQKSQVPFTLNPLPEAQLIYDFSENRGVILDDCQKEIELHYPSVQAFFRSLKKTGAGVNLAGDVLTFRDMKRLISCWQQKGQEEIPAGVTLTCKVHYFSIVKQ